MMSTTSLLQNVLLALAAVEGYIMLAYICTELNASPDLHSSCAC